MKISDLIKRLQTGIDNGAGDQYIRDFSIYMEDYKISYFMNSKTRKKANGDNAKMSPKEFKEFVLSQKEKNKNGNK